MVKRGKTAVIGLGNRLLADEGAGLHALDLLREKLKGRESGIDLVEAGTPGMNLLHQLQEREKIIFIDAGNCESKPGEYKRFLPHEVVSRKVSGDYSLHEFDLIKFLEFARGMGLAENLEIVIYCIQAVKIEMSEALSPLVMQHLPGLVQDVYDELRGRSETVTPGIMQQQ